MLKAYPIRTNIDRYWQAMPAWKRARLRIKEVVPEQRLWIKALYILAESGNAQAGKAMNALFEKNRRGHLHPRQGLRAPQQQRKAIPVALEIFVGIRPCRKR